MTASLQEGRITAALGQRLQAVSPLLRDHAQAAPDGPSVRDASSVLDLLVGAVRSDLSPQRFWILCVAVFGAFPTADEVVEGVRFFRRASVTDATIWMLDTAVRARRPGAATCDLEVVTDRVIVDVDHSARFDLHTGIQQVVRRTLPIWNRDHAITMTAWTDLRQSFRALTTDERDRVLQPSHGVEVTSPGSTRPLLIVPWRTVVVLAETPPIESCGRLAALAQFSGNVVVAVGYDCIPIVSADLVPPADPARFAQYLTIIKHTDRVAAISTSAAAEFQGFADALPAQGRRGPAVFECSLPSEAVVSSGLTALPVTPLTAEELPVILCVGSLEPRKNHLAVLYAAERLWREGLAFRLLFIGGSGWGDEVPRRVAELQSTGRPVEIRRAVSDHELAAAYRTAQFTVFASLHEGYGLPVAESLAQGTPVITSDYGSTKEIAGAGGCLLIDPRDDEMLVDAVRGLLTDSELLGRLRTEIALRPTRTWEEFSAELWGSLVEPGLVAVRNGVTRS